jgi:superfamily II DNA or RNA helicase
MANKAILSNKIYLDTTPELLKSITDSLTYKIKKKMPGRGPFGSFEIVKNYKLLPKGIRAIPSGRLDLIPEGYEVIDKRIEYELPFPKPTMPLNEEQQKVYDKVTGSCFINAMVGWGKTFTALTIARKLGQKTLIVCHNTMLRDQWVLEVKKLYNMPVGVIGSGVFDIDHTIVVGNIQTLTKLAPSIAKEFGTIIIDECHHVTASTFSSFLDSMYSKNKIGLSGTMIRTDGKHILFKDFFGLDLFQPPQSNTMVPYIQVLKPGIRLADGEGWAKKMNILQYDPSYQEFIAEVARVQESKGYKVLIIADRVEFLHNVGKLIGKSCVCVTGGSDLEIREAVKSQIESGEKTSICGSRQIFSEGISINPLSCVILAAPIASESLLEQIIGRIQRMYPDKPTPVVVDIHFSGPADRVQNRFRLTFYARKGWKVIGA